MCRGFRATAQSTLIMRTRYQHLSTGFILAYANMNVCREPPAACTPIAPPLKRGQKMRKIIHSRHHIKPVLNEQVHYRDHEMAHAIQIIRCIGPARCPQKWSRHSLTPGHPNSQILAIHSYE